MNAHWTRKITFEADANDWVVLQESLVVGRVMLDDQQSSRLGRPQWAWSVVTMPSKNGYSDSMPEALEEVRGQASDTWAHKPHGWPNGAGDNRSLHVSQRKHVSQDSTNPLLEQYRLFDRQRGTPCYLSQTADFLKYMTLPLRH